MSYKGPVEIGHDELMKLYGKLHAAYDLLEEVSVSCNLEDYEKIWKFLKEVD